MYRNEPVFNLSYPVSIGESALKDAANFITDKNPSSVFILVDNNTSLYCLPFLLKANSKFRSSNVIEIHDGEGEKNFNTVGKIISRLLNDNADRKSLLINLGGGVVCDIGGFAASVYKRGIEFVNIPTTLLSMVDASVGGKTGINFLDRKNIIGTFTKPSGIFIYPSFIKSLSQAEIRSGYAEMIKHILLSDIAIWIDLKNKQQNYFEYDELPGLIKHSVKFKSEITENDFHESSKRKILNFGHTIGHAIESHSLKTNNPLRHGEAIAAGMIAELYISKRIFGFPEDELNDAVHLIRNLFNDVQLNFSPADLFQYLISDKKNSNKEIAFSLLKFPGNPAALSFPEHEIINESLSFLLEVFSKTKV